MARHQKRFTAQQWSDLILEHQACGESVEVFCARKRIGASTFSKWRRRFQDERDVPTRIATKASPGFVEAVSPSAAVVSLVLGRGVRLEFPVALGPEKIAELTHALVSHEQH